MERRTTANSLVPEPEGIRGYGILVVILYHYVVDYLYVQRLYTPDWPQRAGWALDLLGRGWIMIPVFFCMSGFVIALPFARYRLRGGPSPPLTQYYVRRLARIEPPYFLTLIAIYLFVRNPTTGLRNFGASFLYSHHYLYGYTNPSALFSWSLEVEVAFYVIAPLLCLVYGIRHDGWRCAAQLGLMVAVSRVEYWAAGHPAGSYTLAVHLSYFLAGLLLADLYVCGRLPRLRSLAWDATALVFLLALVDAAGVKPSLAPYPLAPYLILGLMCAVLQSRFSSALLAWKPIGLVGGMCYTLYLWHEVFILAVPWTVKRHLLFSGGMNSSLAYAGVMALVMLAVGVPLFLLIEKPFMGGPGSRFIQRMIGKVIPGADAGRKTARERSGETSTDSRARPYPDTASATN